MENIQQLAVAMFGGVMQFFSLPWPGSSMTIGEVQIGAAVVGLSIMVLNFVFGIGGAGGVFSRGGARRGKHRTSKEREGDEL